MQEFPLWVNESVARFTRTGRPQYPRAIWRAVSFGLTALVGDETHDAWAKLEKRLSCHSEQGRDFFVTQVCSNVASSYALPLVSPGEARKISERTRRSVFQLLAVLPAMLPTSRSIFAAADMRLASAQARIFEDKKRFIGDMFVSMLVAFKTDVDMWQKWNSRIAKPDADNASRLLLVRELTETMCAYFSTPLRSVVADLANAVFPHTPPLDAATVAKLAPLNKKRRLSSSLHALE